MNDGEVVVVKAIDLPNIYGNGMPGQPYAYVDPASIIEEWKQESEKEFIAMRKSAGSAFANVSFRIETGHMKDAILKLIETEKIDLVVMGTKGATGVREFFIGSNTEKIVRVSPVPVFAIHKPLHVRNIRNIIFPTTLDLTQNALLEKIKELQRVFNAVIHVLNVNVYMESLTSDEEMRTSMENYVKFYGLANYKVHVSNSPNVEEGIAKCAARVPRSIIAMATHGNQGITHLLTGSVAEDVVNHVDEPVWTYTLN
jgi:nucleotide-binding universal stress UspA family protein